MPNVTDQLPSVKFPNLTRPCLPAPPKIEIVAVDEKKRARFGLDNSIRVGVIFPNTEVASEALGFSPRSYRGLKLDRVRQKMVNAIRRTSRQSPPKVIVTLRGVGLRYEPDGFATFQRERDAYHEQERAYWRTFLTENGYLNGDQYAPGWQSFLIRHRYGSPLPGPKASTPRLKEEGN